MKGIFHTLRGLTAIASLLGLAACGGSAVTNVSMGGTVTGLSSGPLVLSNGLSSVTIAAGTTAFTFPSRTTVGYSYGVVITSQPANLTCVLTNNVGIATTSDITNITATCATNNNLGGSVSNLTAPGLILANGSDTVSVPANGSTFVFPTKIVAGINYGVTILQQPAPQFCTVANGSSTMGSADVTSIAVTCN